MDEETNMIKYYFIFCVIIILITYTALSIKDYNGYLKESRAMELGYEQVVEEGYVLWKKIE